MAAAWALSVAGEDKRTALQVRKLLHHWSSIRHNVALIWTSAATHGILGEVDLDRALTDLKSVAKVGDVRLVGVLMISMSNLFDLAEQSRAFSRNVLAALVNWTSDRLVKNLAITGLLVFLGVADERATTPPEGASWPKVLWWTEEFDVDRGNVALLWQRALNEKGTRDRALEVLRKWMFMPTQNGTTAMIDMYPSLQQLFIEIAQESDRSRERLQFYLSRWIRETPDQSHVARRILAAIA